MVRGAFTGRRPGENAGKMRRSSGARGADSRWAGAAKRIQMAGGWSGFVSRWRISTSTGAHRSIAGAAISFIVRAWRVTEPMTKFSCEMRVVVEATSMGDFAERLAGAQQRPAM
jgi:hypothetical protein